MRTKTRGNWNHFDWEVAVSSLPVGLTLKQASRKLRSGYAYSSIKLRQHGYKVKDTRGGWNGKRKRKLTPAKIKRINWKLRDATLGRKYKVSRERIRQVRNAVGKPRRDAK